MVVATLLLLISIAGATTCVNKSFNTTGSLSRAGPKINDTFQTSQWSFTNQIFESPNPYAPHVSTVRRLFELQTSPFQNLSSPSYPLSGCLIVLVPTTRTFADGIHDDGTCSSLLSPSCRSELIKAVNTTAATLSGTSGGNCSSFQQLLKNIVSEAGKTSCRSLWSNLGSSTDLSAPGIAVVPSDDDCTLTNLNAPNASETGYNFFAKGWTTFGGNEGDYTGYDFALSVPIPMVLTTWAKPGVSTEKWADTQVLCVPGNKTVAAGSRNVGAYTLDLAALASSTSAPTSGGERLRGVALMAVSVAVVVFAFVV